MIMDGESYKLSLGSWLLNDSKATRQGHENSINSRHATIMQAGSTDRESMITPDWADHDMCMSHHLATC